MFNLKLFWFGIVFISCTSNSFGQKTVTETGQYQMKVNDNTTYEDAKARAIKLAQINAIENAFGKVVVQDNSTYIQNNQQAGLVKTNSAFNFISNSYVKGEWIEDIDEPKIEKIQQGDDTWVKVIVKGKIRELISTESKFLASTLSCPEKKCQTQNFNDGQDFYLYFKSPEDGYVSCYITDPETKYTFLLLPYKKSAKYKKCLPVKADKEYIFFCKRFDYFQEPEATDEQTLSLSANNFSEKYQVWVLFSSKEIDKPALEDETTTTNKFLDHESIKQGYTLPKGMQSDKFAEWLQAYRIHDNKVQLSTIFINLQK
jgi:hypothetical protein